MAKAQVKETTDDKENFVDELKAGTKLMHGQYTIESFLNAGGFGITYLARDSLDRKIVIKECFPGAFCRRSRYVVQARSRAHQNELKSIVRLFVQEARSLAKLDHPNIVGVHQVFEDNDTAYMALDFVEGRDLLDTIEDPNHGLNPTQIKSILKDVLGAVGFIHDQGILHRDISPDNILINQDFHPVLIDFGAAREEATKQSRVLSALRVVKDGYSPQEFYIAGSDQSPSSDLYALGASFYHLIAGDTPPNSQARLAAIASGEPDPFEPLAGRFPDYDDDFLAAMDKALAVLPKDRVQSAKEWVDMMEGTKGNVTPLKVAAAEVAPVAEAATAQKSKMPLLLGSAAAVALLVGVGVLSMSGGEDAPEVAVEAPVAAVETAPVVEPAPEPVTTAEATTEPEAELPAFLTQRADEETAAAEEAAVEPVVQEPATEQATAAIAEPVAPAEEATPTVAPEPEAVQTPTEDPVVVEGPLAVDVPTPAVRPAVRPESVELAAIPEPEPLPEPVTTPRPAVAEPATGTDFPDQTANRPAADSDTAEMTFPATPDTISEIGAGPSVEIAAVTPGNELVPEVPAAAPVEAVWNVRLPFTAAGETSNIIAAAGQIAPVWVQRGLVITDVNGTSVDAISEIADVLREQTATDEISATIPVVFGTLDPATGEAAEQAWFLPVVQQVTLADGTAFETSFAGSGWQTKVTDVSATQTGDIKVGDVLSQYMATQELLNGRDTLSDLLARETDAGVSLLSFAVQRDGSLWVASLNLADAAE